MAKWQPGGGDKVSFFKAQVLTENDNFSSEEEKHTLQIWSPDLKWHWGGDGGHKASLCKSEIQLESGNVLFWWVGE